MTKDNDQIDFLTQAVDIIYNKYNDNNININKDNYKQLQLELAILFFKKFQPDLSDIPLVPNIISSIIVLTIGFKKLGFSKEQTLELIINNEKDEENIKQKINEFIINNNNNNDSNSKGDELQDVDITTVQ